MKSGTTWLHDQLVNHPECGPAVVPGREYRHPDYVGKQLHFFDQYCSLDDVTDIRQGYCRFFPEGKKRGEFTPRYFTDYWTPELVRTAVPGAKLLLLLRDPVERYESELAHMRRYKTGDGGVKVDFDLPMWHEIAFLNGLYAHHLERWLLHFPIDQIWISTLEECVADPLGTLRSVGEFLGLADVWGENYIVNPNPSTSSYVLPGRLRASLTSAYRGEVHRLAKMVPELALDRWSVGTPGRG